VLIYNKLQLRDFEKCKKIDQVLSFVLNGNEKHIQGQPINLYTKVETSSHSQISLKERGEKVISSFYMNYI